MQWLAALCVKRPVFATVLILSLTVIGAFSFTRLGVDRFPKVDFPTVVITTVQPGAAPEQIETEVTDKIEEAVNTISGIDELRSVSSEGISQVIIAFLLDKNTDVAAQEVRDKVNSVLPLLPKTIQQPRVDKFDPDAAPVLSLALSARLRTGAASGSNRSTRGCWIVLGSCGSTPLTLSRTSCAATSVFLSSRNEIITCEIPSDDTDRSSSMPLIVLTASSILSVISVSICSGAAPGCTVVITMVGKSIFGKRSTPSFVNEYPPMTTSERMRTVAKTGRLTHSAASHCMMHLHGDPERVALRRM